MQVRYDDPEVRTFKLNAERQNGRAAMLGITGCLIHELLGVDALYPTGGLGGAAPPPIIAALAVQGRAGSVQMFSEGCARFLAFLTFDIFTLYTRIIDERISASPNQARSTWQNLVLLNVRRRTYT